MVGVLIATHGPLAQALLSEAVRLTGPVEGFRAVEVSTIPPVEELRRLFLEQVMAVDDGDGVLILVDCLGGTPCNLSLALHLPHPVEVVTGANLPMVLRALMKRGELPLQGLADEVVTYGARAISRRGSKGMIPVVPKEQ